jgi:hypothetical protein
MLLLRCKIKVSILSLFATAYAWSRVQPIYVTLETQRHYFFNSEYRLVSPRFWQSRFDGKSLILKAKKNHVDET